MITIKKGDYVRVRRTNMFGFVTVKKPRDGVMMYWVRLDGTVTPIEYYVTQIEFISEVDDE